MMANLPTSQILASKKHVMRMSKMGLVRYPLSYYQVKLTYKTHQISSFFDLLNRFSHSLTQNIHSLVNCSPKGEFMSAKDLEV
jgi:hypothetical protein